MRRQIRILGLLGWKSHLNNRQQRRVYECQFRETNLRPLDHHVWRPFALGWVQPCLRGQGAVRLSVLLGQKQVGAEQHACQTTARTGRRGAAGLGRGPLLCAGPIRNVEVRYLLGQQFEPADRNSSLAQDWSEFGECGVRQHLHECNGCAEVLGE